VVNVNMLRNGEMANVKCGKTVTVIGNLVWVMIYEFKRPTLFRNIFCLVDSIYVVDWLFDRR